MVYVFKGLEIFSTEMCVVDLNDEATEYVFSPPAVKEARFSVPTTHSCLRDCDATANFRIIDPSDRITSIVFRVGGHDLEILRSSQQPHWRQLQEIFISECPLLCMPFSEENLHISCKPKTGEKNEVVTVQWDKLKFFPESRSRCHQGNVTIQYAHGIVGAYAGGQTMLMREGYGRDQYVLGSPVGHFRVT